MRGVSIASLALGAALVGAQLVPLGHANPPVRSDLAAPAGIDRILRVGCYDCHSNQTEWPWYSDVAPLSWWLEHDVVEGRQRLNFSEWGEYASDPDTAAHKLDEISQAVANGGMAPWYYRMLHPGARLSSAQRAQLVEWASGTAAALRSPARGE